MAQILATLALAAIVVTTIAVLVAIAVGGRLDRLTQKDDGERM